MTVDLTDTAKQRLETSIIAGTLVVLAVATRFWCKFSLKDGIHAEDWWILAAVPIYLGGVADDIWGNYIRVLPPPSLRRGTDRTRKKGVYNGISGEDSKQVIATLLTAPTPELALALENYLKVDLVRGSSDIPALTLFACY